MTAFFLAAAVLIWLDQWTKGLASAHLKGQEPIVLIPNVFELQYLENRGAAFGMLQGRQMFFFLVAIVVFAAVLCALYRMPFTRRYLPLGICMVLLIAGALGNLIDRVSQKFVVDFLYFSLIDFPIFNVADCYVTIAALLLVILVMWYYKEEELAVFFPGKNR
ncbi:MAG: signal peptidase II [Lachnospiraceae bacterium]|nr:signal peptidase II [Lachnospiraceae bacterium]